MAGIEHIGVGLAAKKLAPQAPLWTLVVASEAIDLLWGIFALTRVENFQESPWSHGLFMSAVWSILAGTLATRILRNSRAGIVMGLVVFSHWVLDFITHPMFGGPLDLPLLFNGSPKVGLGLYSSIAPGFTVVFEFVLVLLGLGIYLQTRGVFKQGRPGKKAGFDEINPS
jgi:hypothetical protein